MHRPRRGSPGFLILKHWFRFHLLIAWSNLKRQVAMHGTPKIPSESLSRDVSCGAGSDERCDFACHEGTWTMRKTLLLNLGATFVTLSASLNVSLVLLLHSFKGNRHEGNFTVAGSSSRGRIIKRLAHIKGSVNTKQ